MGQSQRFDGGIEEKRFDSRRIEESKVLIVE